MSSSEKRHLAKVKEFSELALDKIIDNQRIGMEISASQVKSKHVHIDGTWQNGDHRIVGKYCRREWG